VKTNHPMNKVLLEPDLVGQMINWSVELFEYGLSMNQEGPSNKMFGRLHNWAQPWAWM